MNKLLVITVLAALLAINVEGFRVARQVDEVEQVDPVDPVDTVVAEVEQVAEVEPEAEVEQVQEQGTFTKVTSAIRTYYDQAVDKASGYVESIKGLKLEEKAQNAYAEATKVMSTYAGIFQDQVYHIVYQQQ